MTNNLLLLKSRLTNSNKKHSDEKYIKLEQWKARVSKAVESVVRVSVEKVLVISRPDEQGFINDFR